MAKQPNAGRVDWGWVRDWAGRVFLAGFCLVTFGYLAASPVVRPGGVMDTLPTAMLWGAVGAGAATLVTAGVLAVVSARRS